MEQGFIRVGAATPSVSVADPAHNRNQIEELCREAAARQVKVLVFPELCLTGYTCSDLFLQDTLLESARRELSVLADHTKNLDLLIFVGLPWMRDGLQCGGGRKGRPNSGTCSQDRYPQLFRIL